MRIRWKRGPLALALALAALILLGGGAAAEEEATLVGERCLRN